MKKLIAIILILAMLLPAVALAERDPIVGTWYVYTGIVEEPELKSKAYFEISLFSFTDDGIVFTSTYDVSEKGITTVNDYQMIGLWTNKDGKYYVNVGMKGAKEITVEENSLFFPVDDYSIRVRKMEPVDFALDMMF